MREIRSSSTHILIGSPEPVQFGNRSGGVGCRWNSPAGGDHETRRSDGSEIASHKLSGSCKGFMKPAPLVKTELEPFHRAPSSLQIGERNSSGFSATLETLIEGRGITMVAA
jgi:hypothetical protein